jgi:hypothetical protein
MIIDKINFRAKAKGQTNRPLYEALVEQIVTTGLANQ